MKHVQIKIKLDNGATMPTRATDGSVGYDVTALKAVLVDTNGNRVTFTDYTKLDRYIYASGFCGEVNRIRSQYKRVIIDTGVHVTPADGYYVELVPNSRLAKTGLVYGNSFGVIDPDYTGSIKCVLNITSSATPEDLETVSAGSVIGQLIIREKVDAVFEQVDELEQTERGEGGFGSTAKQ